MKLNRMYYKGNRAEVAKIEGWARGRQVMRVWADGRWSEAGRCLSSRQVGRMKSGPGAQEIPVSKGKNTRELRASAKTQGGRNVCTTQVDLNERVTGEPWFKYCTLMRGWGAGELAEAIRRRSRVEQVRSRVGCHAHRHTDQQGETQGKWQQEKHKIKLWYYYAMHILTKPFACSQIKWP